MDFDTTLTSFKSFDTGYVKVGEMAQALAEAETDLNFITTTLASHVKSKNVNGGISTKDFIYLTRGLKQRQRTKILDSADSPGISKAASSLISLEAKWLKEFEKNNYDGHLNIYEEVFGQPLKTVKLAHARRNSLWLKVEDFHKLLIKNGFIDIATKIQSKTVFTSLDLEKKANKTKLSKVWPWGGHTTYLLEVLSLTAEKWWSRYTPTDSTTASKQDEVTEWILNEFGDRVSQANAYAIAKILRPDDLSKGRPKK